MFVVIVLEILKLTIAGTLGAPPYKKFTIEVAQSSIPIFTYKIPSDIKLYEISIPHEYRINAQAYIEKLVKPYNIVIDPIWKTPRNDEIKGELIMDKDWNEENDWEKEKIVLYLHGGAYSTGNSKIAHDFCSLCDSLAAYLYLMNPPKDSGFKAYKPEQIVFGGDSAGGGLVVSLGLAIRDLGLPLPAGNNFMACDETDFLPPLPGFKFARNTNSDAYREFRTRSGNIIRNIQKNPEIKIIGDESLKRIGNQSVSFYVVNEGLGIPYVSPMLAESLGGLPPLLIIAGNVERLRDEAIYLAYRASNPEKYRLPKYEVDFDNSRFKSPSKQVILEIYDEMFHNFHYSSLEAAKVTVRRASEFISTVIQEALQANPTSNKFETYKITYQGEVQNFDESSIENVLTWDKAGVFPGV
ncbi:unnamed protein product [Rhizophagus irregularis]|nr:unnamed protein product [Rhizophagus irregularis]